MPFYIGLMSGTSMDAVDAALVEITGDECRQLAFHHAPLPAEVRAALVRCVTPHAAVTLEELGTLHVRVGELFADAALAVLAAAQIEPSAVAAIGSHGQTVYHKPEPPHAFTLQLGDPNTIAASTGITTVADFRGADIAAGGQGAPLAPAFHAARFSAPQQARAVVNLGGIANITVLSPGLRDGVIGFDTGPGNALLDEWILRSLGTPMDTDGAWARSGAVDEALLARVLDDPYFKSPPPKSTGRDYFNMEWLTNRLREYRYAPQDVQATLVELTAQTIADAVQTYAPDTEVLLVCGGGAKNPEIMAALARALKRCTVASTRDYGIPPECVEAIAFAWLAKRRLDGLPGNLPAVTGARSAVLLGAVYAPRV